MNFVSYAFLALLSIVLICRLTLGTRKTETSYSSVLLVASLVFYGWHVPVFLAILVAAATVDYIAALLLDDRDQPSGAFKPHTTRGRRAVLFVSLATNLGILAYFKYSGFFVENVSVMLQSLGLGIQPRDLAVALPMGISFYTFQSMSYTIDVYRRTLTPIRDFGRFILFIAFFPQLVAGPIVRASEFLPQLDRIRRLRPIVAAEGLFLIVSGYFLKVVCADNLGTQVDRHWELGYTSGADSGLLFALSIMFAGQIFCDFAGYSRIAQGIAYLLGFRLPLNFDHPYLAYSFKNFWERWHITLSRWLRDYLYVPLGGNRGSRTRTYVNLLLVMVLGGLWHGAAWTYVAWGTLHGVALALERWIGLHRPGTAPRPLAVRLTWYLLVQLVVLVTWVLFRSDTLPDAWQFLVNISAVRLAPLPTPVAFGLLFLVPVLLMHLWGWLVERGTCRPLGLTGRAVLAGAMLSAIASTYGTTTDFIYFQF